MISWIKNKLINILLIIITILSIIIFFLHREKEKNKMDKEDYRSLYKSETDNSRVWKSKDSLNHILSEMHYLNSRKLLEENARVHGAINSLEGKISKLQGYRETASTSEYHFKTYMRDSFLFDTIRVSVIDKKDPKGYYSFHEIIKGNDVEVWMSAVDTSEVGIYNGKRENKFLFFRYGKRKMNVEMVNKNPYVKTVYNREVYVKKRKP